MILKFSIFSTNIIQNNFAEKRKFKFTYSMDFSDSGIAVMLQANVLWCFQMTLLSSKKKVPKRNTKVTSDLETVCPHTCQTGI